MFILSLPTAVGITIAILVFVSFSISLYFVVHRFWSSDISDDTRKCADTIATRIGVIHAVVIGMMFTSVRIEYNEMIVAIESEASALARLYGALERRGDAEFSRTREQLVEYIRFVVDEQWPALREMRLTPTTAQELSGRSTLDQVWRDLEKIEYKPGDLNLKTLLDQVEDYKIQRLFDTKGKLLPAFWLIALIGYLLTLLTLYLPPPSFKRCLLISFYSSMVGLVLVGIFILTHPYSSAAGVSPDVFQWMLDVTHHK